MNLMCISEVACVSHQSPPSHAVVYFQNRKLAQHGLAYCRIHPFNSFILYTTVKQYAVGPTYCILRLSVVCRRQFQIQPIPYVLSPLGPRPPGNPFSPLIPSVQTPSLPGQPGGPGGPGGPGQPECPTGPPGPGGPQGPAGPFSPAHPEETTGGGE